MATRVRKTDEDKKSYKVKINEVVEVKFAKDGYRYKKGDEIETSLPIAYKWWGEGKIEKTAKVRVALENAGLLELAEEKAKENDDKTKTTKKAE